MNRTFPTAIQSAALKQMLKKRRATNVLRRMAERHPVEAEEAVRECETGLDYCVPLSWVWEQMAPPPRSTP